VPGIAIIENSDGLADYFTRYLDGIDHEIFQVWKTPRFPAEEYDAYILTGDYNNVSDGLLQFHSQEVEFLRKIEDKKIFGSCFAHQLLCQAFGGKVSKREKRFFGWHQIFIQEPHTIFEGITNPYFLSLNGDEVTVIPDTARILATNPQCRYQLLLLGEDILTCQSHPEIQKQEALALIEKHKERLSIRCSDLDLILERTERFAEDAVNQKFMGNVVRWLVS
jgi:GMP synthase-like glutamine amidotransferase